MLAVSDSNSIFSKRVGLDKAFYQVQQAVKRARKSENPSTEDDSILTRLRDIINDMETGGSGIDVSPSQDSRYGGQEGDGDSDEDDDAAGVEHDGPSTAPAEFPQPTEETLDVDGAENPLQLLARASYFRPTHEQAPRSHLSPQKSRLDGQTDKSSSSEIRQFFASPTSDLDIGDDIDPITLGLVSEDEAENLFTL